MLPRWLSLSTAGLLVATCWREAPVAGLLLSRPLLAERSLLLADRLLVVVAVLVAMLVVVLVLVGVAKSRLRPGAMGALAGDQAELVGGCWSLVG